MGSAAKKKRPMRSRRSGVKKFELVKANLAILQKLAALFIIVLFAACTPVQYVYVDPQDSVIRKQRVVFDYHVIPSVFYFSRPFFNPYTFQRQRTIIVPQRPAPRYVQPLQRPITPWRVPRRN